jgi:argininosuccinate lyase
MHTRRWTALGTQCKECCCVQGSKAYARALAKVAILTEDEAHAVINGLVQVGREWESGSFEIKPGDEDIHTANERRLTELVGAVGGKLHTGRFCCYAALPKAASHS